MLRAKGEIASGITWLGPNGGCRQLPVDARFWLDGPLAHIVAKLSEEPTLSFANGYTGLKVAICLCVSECVFGGGVVL